MSHLVRQWEYNNEQKKIHPYSYGAYKTVRETNIDNVITHYYYGMCYIQNLHATMHV